MGAWSFLELLGAVAARPGQSLTQTQRNLVLAREKGWLVDVFTTTGSVIITNNHTTLVCHVRSRVWEMEKNKKRRTMENSSFRLMHWPCSRKKKETKTYDLSEAKDCK